jgi:hypothetical protein
MLTEQDVIGIYAEHGIKVTAKDARDDIAHMGAFPKSRSHAIELVHGYAAQQRGEIEAGMREAVAFENDR